MIVPDEVLFAIKDYIVCTTILDVLTREQKILPTIGMKMPFLLSDRFERWQEKAVQEQYRIRNLLRKESSKLVDYQRLPDRVKVIYMVCGYKHETVILGIILKAEVETRLMEWEKGY